MTTTEPELVSDQRMTKTARRARPSRNVERTMTNLASFIRKQGRRPDQPGAGANDVIDVPTLKAFVVMVEAAEEALRDAVLHLRAQDPPVSWAAIGAELGLTKQAVFARYAGLRPADATDRLASELINESREPGRSPRRTGVRQ